MESDQGPEGCRDDDADEQDDQSGTGHHIADQIGQQPVDEIGLDRFEAPFVGVHGTASVVDDGIQPGSYHETEHNGCQGADYRYEVKDHRHDQVQNEIEQEIAETVPGIEDVAYLGPALATDEPHQGAGIAGYKADIGKRNPDNHHENQRQDDQIHKITFPEVQ